MSSWPEDLRHADFARLLFALDFNAPCRVQPGDFLALGRRLKSSAPESLRRCSPLFGRAPSDDPVALRRHQKPAPPYVARVPINAETVIETGDRLDLEVLFFGTGLSSIGDFLVSLAHLGRHGLIAGEGGFDVVQLNSVGPDGAAHVIWREGEREDCLVPIVQSLDWFLESRLPRRSPVRLRFVTPTRMLSDGRPLRQPRFVQVFPFLLRRVTSMLHACCDLEPLDEPQRLLDLAREVAEPERQLRWRDWRTLGDGATSIGGFTGHLDLAGPALEDLLWVIGAATLFGAGRSAAYGAGHMELHDLTLLP